MIEQLDIEGYRGIARGTLSELMPLNILVGPNNSGKSSVLEALLIADARGGGEGLLFAARHRGWAGPATIAAMFSGQARLSITRNGKVFQGKLSSSAPGTVEFSNTGGASAHATIHNGGSGYSGGTEFKPTFIETSSPGTDPDKLDAAVSRADLQGERQALIALLQPLLPGLRDLRILQSDGQYSLFVEDDTGHPWPAVVAGDGFKRLILLASQIAADQSGLVLLEEPETFLHVGALAQVAKVLWQAIGKKQLVITTHSLELIDAIFESPSAQPDKAALYRMSLRKGELKAVRVPGMRAKELRAEIGEDLRR
jgi:hypothetical protein